MRRQAADIADVVALMARGLDHVPAADVDASPLLRASAYFREALATVPTSARRRAERPETRREGTVAELRSIEDVADSFRLRYAGMLRRGLEGLPDGVRPQEALADLAERHEAWLARATESHAGLDVLPIRDLVAIQYGAILSAGEHLTATAPSRTDG